MKEEKEEQKGGKFNNLMFLISWTLDFFCFTWI